MAVILLSNAEGRAIGRAGIHADHDGRRQARAMTTRWLA
jgi:hypothetical protein